MYMAGGTAASRHTAARWTRQLRRGNSRLWPIARKRQNKAFFSLQKNALERSFREDDPEHSLNEVKTTRKTGGLHKPYKGLKARWIGLPTAYDPGQPHQVGLFLFAPVYLLPRKRVKVLSISDPIFCPPRAELGYTPLFLACSPLLYPHSSPCAKAAVPHTCTSEPRVSQLSSASFSL